MENENKDKEYSPIAKDDLWVEDVSKEKKEDENKTVVIQMFKDGDKNKLLYNKCDNLKVKKIF